AVRFEHQDAETYICGNPPYIGDKFQTESQKADLRQIDGGKTVKAIDYIAGWLWKASQFIKTGGSFAFVSTNSV
ncbi:DNA methyltransferase, partial [Escherichia coli]|uniref:DNA methyltransferase n=1 Tax=Escherichia coli TaxID=562 RepID=UPI0039E00391